MSTGFVPEGIFRPRIIQRWQRRLAEFDITVISLGGKGLTASQIARHLARVWGTRISHPTVSAITSWVRHEMVSWCNRPLTRSYPVIFLDALHVKMREQRLANRPVYLAWGLGDGSTEVPGLWGVYARSGRVHGCSAASSTCCATPSAWCVPLAVRLLARAVCGLSNQRLILLGP
ncbi:transposase [Streptomyces sp. x-80]|uniref:transposase n=1 Tax=Streptomyces sp. x-80 TaxID=2789282 RepID=UPI003980A15B